MCVCKMDTYIRTARFPHALCYPGTIEWVRVVLSGNVSYIVLLNSVPVQYLVE